MKKGIAAAALIAIAVVLYFGYARWEQHKFVSAITPHVKNSSLRLGNAIRLETDGAQKITFKEVFEKLELDIAEIDKKILEIQTLSTPSNADITEPVVAYVRGAQELLRSQLAKYRKELALSTAMKWMESSTDILRTTRSFGSDYALQAARKAAQDGETAKQEYDSAKADLTASAAKMGPLRQAAARFIAADALVDVATLEALGKKEPPSAPAASAAAAPKAPPSAPGGEIKVKIAHAGPLTGSIAFLGKDDANGVELAIQHVNERKLTIGGNRVAFEFVNENDGADPVTGVAVANRLLATSVAAVIGHLNSGVAIPASKIYSSAGIPMISGSATNPALTERGIKTVFRTIARDDQQGPAAARYIVAEIKPRTAVIIHDGTAYGEGITNEVDASLRASGVKVIARQRTSYNETEFKPILRKINAATADVIFYGGMDMAAGALVRQARELGITAAFVSGDGACTDEMDKIAGSAAEGMICTQAGLAKEGASRAFRDAFNARYGDIKQYAPYYYDATMAVVEAMKKADSTDPSKFAPQLFKISFEGATGKVEFDSKGDRRDAEITIFRMQKGKVVPIAVVTGVVVKPFTVK